MTAPAAPRITVRNDGTAIFVRWVAVPLATYYRVHIDEHATATTVVDTVLEADEEEDGRYQSITVPYVGLNWVNVTSFNAGDEESAASNEVQQNLSVGGGGSNPTKALRKAVKSL